jgi:dihydropteroate synthase
VTVKLELGATLLDLKTPRIMGVLNRTPDSFSDGGRFTGLDQALSQVEKMVKEGADIVDVGGESTRPGAADVSLQEELDRVLPLIEGIRARFPVPISIDTSKPEVMGAAVAAGAAMINDVYALRRPGALQAAAASGTVLCLMHMQG